MAQTLDTRGGTSRALFKIILMLGLVLAGVAAFAAEPESTTEATPSAGCARTSFEFGGRVTQNGESTDTWTLTCQRTPAPLAANPPAVPAAPVAALPAPVTTLPVATLPAARTDAGQGSTQF